jgi:lysophospholipase L1-like esterase
VASLATLALCALAIETGLRIWTPGALLMHSKKILLPTNKTIENRWNYESDKLRDLIVIHRNSIGFRGPDPPFDFAAALSIVAVGGSTTECSFLTEGKTWPDVVTTALQQEFSNVWLNNAGIDGHTTFGHAALLEQHLSNLRPKVVLFLVGINELAIEAAWSLDNKRLAEDRTDDPQGLLERLRSKSLMLEYLFRARPVRGGHESVAYRDAIVDYGKVGTDAEHVLLSEEDATRMVGPVGEFRERLEGLIEKSRHLGIEPILITQPAVYGFGIDPVTGVDLGRIIVKDFTEGHLPRTGADKWRILQMYNQGTREVAARAGVLVIDLASLMPKRTELYYDFIHFTEQGAAAVGAIVARHLIPHLRARYPGFRR